MDKFRHFSLVSPANQPKASVFDSLEIWPNNDYIKIYEITSRTDLKGRNRSTACAKFIQCTFLLALMLTDTASFCNQHSNPEHCWSDVIISRNESGMTVMIITPHCAVCGMCFLVDGLRLGFGNDGFPGSLTQISVGVTAHTVHTNRYITPFPPHTQSDS